MHILQQQKRLEAEKSKTDFNAILSKPSTYIQGWNEVNKQCISKLTSTHIEDTTFGGASVPSQTKTNHSSFTAFEQ